MRLKQELEQRRQGRGYYGRGCEQAGYGLSGAGFMDMAKKLYSAGQSISEFSSGPVGTFVKNVIPASDDTARPSFQGEKHAILRLPNGRMGIANFMGPQTQVIKRLQRNDPGRTPSDMTAKMHDIQYNLAQGANSEQEQLRLIRDADNRMIRNLNRIEAEGSDSRFNTKQGKLIAAKTKLEDAGVLDPKKFAGNLRDIPESENILLNKAKKELEMEGYGKPGEALKKKILKQIHAKVSRKTRKDSLRSKKKVGKGLNPSGGGTTTRGGSLDVLAVVKHVLPFITKELNLPKSVFPTDKILKIIGNMKGSPKDIVAKITPIIYKLILSHGLKGNGMKGKGKRKKLVGGSLPPVHQSLMSKIGEIMWKAVKWVGKNKHTKKLLDFTPSDLFEGSGLNPSGGGTTTRGGSFASFFKGFVKILKPIASVAGTVLSTVGVPEAGIPLKIASGLM